MEATGLARYSPPASNVNSTKISMSDSLTTDSDHGGQLHCVLGGRSTTTMLFLQHFLERPPQQPTSNSHDHQI